MLKRIISLLLLLLSTVGYLSAGTARLSLNPNRLTVGERATLSISLNDFDNMNVEQIVRPRNIPGVDIHWNEGPGRQSTMNMINGQVTRSLTLTWPVSGKQKGQFQIPPMQVQVDGQTVSTNAVGFVVEEIKSDGRFKIQVHASSKQAWVGQPFFIYIDLLIADLVVRGINQQLGQNYELANHYEPVQVPATLQNGLSVEAVNSRSQQGRDGLYGVNAGTVTIDGSAYHRQRITLQCIPDKTGRITFPQISAAFHEVRAVQQGVGFFRRIGVQPLSQAVVDTSNPVGIEVRELPGNAPEGFTGLVASNLEAELKVLQISKNQKVQLHTPIAVEIILRSPAPVEKLKLPEWEYQKELVENFDISKNEVLLEDGSGFRIFKEINFRPINPDVQAIPPLKFPWFDANSGSYKIAQTEPFPIQVESLSLSENLADAPAALLEMKKEETPQATIGHVEELELERERILRPEGKAWNPVFVVALALLPWLFLWIPPLFKTLSDTNRRLRESRKGSLNDSLNQLKETEDSETHLRILRQFLLRNFGTDHPTGVNLNNEDLKSRLTAAMGRLEAGAYAGGASALPGAEELGELLKELHGGSSK